MDFDKTESIIESIMGINEGMIVEILLKSKISSLLPSIHYVKSSLYQGPSPMMITNA